MGHLYTLDEFFGMGEALIPQKTVADANGPNNVTHNLAQKLVSLDIVYFHTVH